MYRFIRMHIYIYIYLIDQTCVPWFIHCVLCFIYRCAKTHAHVSPARDQDKQSRHPHPSPKPLPAPHINKRVYIHIYCYYTLYILFHNTVYNSKTQHTSSSFAKATTYSTRIYMCIYTHILSIYIVHIVPWHSTSSTHTADVLVFCQGCCLLHTYIYVYSYMLLIHIVQYGEDSQRMPEVTGHFRQKSH